ILEVMPFQRSLGRRLTGRERRERTDAVLDQFGLTRIRKNMATQISGGEKRRLEIARCLVCEPLLILLDEPFTGIDPITIAEIRGIVVELKNQGIGVLLTDHNVREALKITTRSYLIKDGKVRTQGTPQEIINDPIAIDEYLGKSFSDEPFAGASPAPTPGESPILSRREPSSWRQPPPSQRVPVPQSELPTETPALVPGPRQSVPALHSVLEEERIHRLVEGL